MPTISDVETLDVAYADRHFRIGQQQAVDRGLQPAKQGRGGCKIARGSVGHVLSPLFGVDSRSLRSRDNLRIPDTSDNFFVCIAAFSILQRTKTGYLRSR